MISAYIRPVSLAEAMKVRAAAASQILCGGTDFYTALGTRLPQGTIIDLTQFQGARRHNDKPKRDSHRCLHQLDEARRHTLAARL